VEVKLLTFLPVAVDKGESLASSPVFSTLGRTPDTHKICIVVPIAGLDTKRKMSCSCWELNPNSSAIQFTAQPTLAELPRKTEQNSEMCSDFISFMSKYFLSILFSTLASYVFPSE
jgi:hypothetical protein